MDVASAANKISTEPMMVAGKAAAACPAAASAPCKNLPAAHEITCKSGAGLIQLALGVATASLYKTSIERAVIVSKVRSLIPSLPL